MTEFIEREAVLKAIHDEWDEVCNYDGSGHALANEMEDVIYRVPTADVQPVVHGQWLKRDDMPRICKCKCSACGYADYPSKNDRYWFERNYCPNCGADMREAKA